jgi:hypothetical protein
VCLGPTIDPATRADRNDCRDGEPATIRDPLHVRTFGVNVDEGYFQFIAPWLLGPREHRRLIEQAEAPLSRDLELVALHLREIATFDAY